MEQPDLEGKRILVVDDNPENLGVVAGYLKSAGYRVAVAPNGSVALERVARIKPVVILLDVKMPGMDGFTVCRELKNNADASDIPVIFLTALDDIDSITRAFRVGGTDHLSKPVNKDELLARVSTHVENYLYKTRLKQEVRRRTAELEESNRLLKEEIRRRKETEKNLRISEERLDLAMDGANDGIWDWNLVNDSVYFDSRYYTMAGYKPDEFPGALGEWQKRVHPDDVDSVNLSVSQYLGGGKETYEVEFRFRRKEGLYMWIRGRGKIVARDKTGKPIRFTGTHTDITEHKRFEEELWQSRQLLNNVFESLQEGIFVLNRDLRCTYWNRGMAEITRTPAKNALGATPGEIFPNLKGAIGGNLIINAMNGEAIRGSEVKHTLPGAREEAWFSRSLFPLRDVDGQIAGVVGLIEDVSSRKRTEEELHGLRARLANVIDSMPSILVGVDVEGRVTLWNKTAVETTGVDAKTALGKIASDVLPRMAPEMEKIGLSIRARRVFQVQEKPRPVENGDRPGVVTIYPLIADGVEGAVIRIDLVSDDKQTQDS
ncbi:MAG: PAS domain S-box protein [Desulfobacterales bacterium]|nr:PAS domain S-box protein [Desulfobacterales bacterium]